MTLASLQHPQVTLHWTWTANDVETPRQARGKAAASCDTRRKPSNHRSSAGRAMEAGAAAPDSRADRSLTDFSDHGPDRDSNLSQQKVRGQVCTRRSDSGSRDARAEGTTAAQGPATASEKRTAKDQLEEPLEAHQSTVAVHESQDSMLSGLKSRMEVNEQDTACRRRSAEG